MKRFIFPLLLSLSTFVLAEEVILTVKEGDLKGDLTVNEQSSKRVAFLISGSGPTDRDGNTVGASGKNNCLKYLSNSLNESGLSTLRIDKRGVGASVKVKEEDLRFSTYVEDVERWIDFLEKKGFTEVILIGHSEGALVGTLAAKHENVVALVAIAGAGRPAGDILREQLKPKLPAGLYTAADTAITKLEAGKLVEDYPASLSSLFRSSVQPYLISWLKVDPAKAISELAIPVFVVQGANDIQVKISDGQILQRSVKGGRILVLGKMNHVLKEVELDMPAQMSSYTDPKLPIYGELPKAITKFISELK